MPSMRKDYQPFSISFDIAHKIAKSNKTRITVLDILIALFVLTWLIAKQLTSADIWTSKPLRIFPVHAAGVKC